MYNYYLNKNAQVTSGDHEVHKDGCYWMPLPANRIYLGSFTSEVAAVNYAKATYSKSKIDGCVHCCSRAHTS